MSDNHLSISLTSPISGFDLKLEETIPLTGVTALFGPSGSGKSLLLRMIAGFDKPESGTISINDKVWFDSERGVDLPAFRRPLGYMFQDTRLFSHLNVRKNLDFALKRALPAPDHIEIDDVIATLGLSSLLLRSPESLSGGEKQRVALARTLLTQPRLLLLDEPLAALDSNSRAHILPYLEKTLHRFDIPTIYVSHSINEVAYLADRVLVLEQGRTQAFGPTSDILERLDLQPVTDGFESGVVLEGHVSKHDPRLCLTHVRLDEQSISMPLKAEIDPGTRLRVRVRARDVAISLTRPEGISIRNILVGTITDIALREGSSYAELLLDIGSARLRARLTRAAIEDLGLAQGQTVHALIKSVSFDSRITTD
jgi:molybdate transport system ATP-binding protein